MRLALFPKTKAGAWSAGLAASFLILLAIFFAFMALGLVTFDAGHWWDWTVGISVLLVLSSFVTGIIAAIKKDKSVLVYISIALTSIAILFLLSHSLFIND